MRDFQAEHDLAVDGLRIALADYQRTLADCRQRLATKREWVKEARRRVARAQAAMTKTPTRKA